MITAPDAIIASITYKGNTLQPNPVKPTQVLLNKVQKMDSKYRTAVRDWVASTNKTEHKMLGLAFDISKDLEELGPEATLELFSGWEERQADLNLNYQAKVESLRELVPVNQSVTLFGVESKPPSTYEQGKWLIQANIFRDPSLFLDKMQSGILSGDEVDALSLFYPSILETIQEVIIEAVSELKGQANLSEDVLGNDKMNIIKKILQIPRLSPAKLEELQARYNKEENAPSDVNIDTDNVQTSAQRVTFK